MIKKRVLSLLLVLTFLCSAMPVASARDLPTDPLEAAYILYDLGLFKGVGLNADYTPNFDLDRAPNRYEAVTILVRLLGEEDEANKGNWNTPFTDVAAWAKPYVGYAYANGLTNGTGTTTFGGNDTVSAAQFITFLLRVLGYSSDVDFRWDAPWVLSDQIGLTDGTYNAANNSVLRGDAAILAVRALETPLKGTSSYKLHEALSFDAFSPGEYLAATTPRHRHSYTGTVIAPTASSQGYTLLTCACGARSMMYENGFVNNGGQGDKVSEDQTGFAGNAGEFVDRADTNRPTFDSSWHKEQLESAINGYIGSVYSIRFFSQGLCNNSNDVGKFAKIVQRDDGTFGVNVFGWRKSYDSDIATNGALNAVMEAFYLLSGDRYVAYALWSWKDEANINGYANSNDFGFNDVAETQFGGIIEMNGIQIEVEFGEKVSTYWFLNTK